MIVSITFPQLFKLCWRLVGAKMKAVSLFCDAVEGKSKRNYSLKTKKKKNHAGVFLKPLA